MNAVVGRAVLVTVVVAAAVAGWAGTSSALTSSAASPRTSASAPGSSVAPAGTVGNVAVSVPPVAFTARAVAVAGHLRTPVLVNAAEADGTVRVDGASDGSCAARAIAGTVTWVDCDLDPGAVAPRLVVTLDDGTTAVQPIDAG